LPISRSISPRRPTNSTHDLLNISERPSKASISLRLDQDVLEWFKAQGLGYHTRINTVLRAFRDASV